MASAFRLAALLGLATLSLGRTALAAAPEPLKSADPAAFAGRWYEVARIHNLLELDCQAPTMDFTATSPGKFTVTQTCRKGSPAGPQAVHKGTGRITDPGNTKMRVAFLGGLYQKDYWLIDHSSDNRWALLATSDGRFLWVLSRQPTLPERAQVLAKAKSLGFDLKKIEYAQQPPA